MKQLLEFPLSDSNETVLIEVESTSEEGYGEIEVSRLGNIAIKARHSFQDAIEIAQPVAEIIIGKFKNLSERPQEIDVEFGLKLNAQAGAVISSSAIEANFKVTLKWKQK